MKKKLFFLILIGLIILTGCGKKQCSKWVTTDGSENWNCKYLGTGCVTTQQCVEWE